MRTPLSLFFLDVFRVLPQLTECLEEANSCCTSGRIGSLSGILTVIILSQLLTAEVTHLWTFLFHEVSLCKTHAFRVRGAAFGAKILALPYNKHKE